MILNHFPREVLLIIDDYKSTVTQLNSPSVTIKWQLKLLFLLGFRMRIIAIND